MSVARIGTACLIVLALVLALPACGDDDDDSVSQEELEAAVEEAEQEAAEQAETTAQIEDLRDEIKSLQDKDAEGGGQSGDTTTTTAIAPNTGGVPGDAESCGQGIYARSGTTSCSFALNVARAYYSSDVNTFEAFSPTTGEAYTMTCSGSGPVICTGGNNAAVYIP